MPEYLAPAVYVEETPSGNKPIEGVGTSTTALVGVTERGPVDVPQLVTSYGEYQRLFGGSLPIDEFTDATGEHHCFLPHAVEGFFVNGGKRAYVTRVLPDEAPFAARDVFFADPALATPGETVLLRAAQAGTGAAVNPPLLMALSPTNLAVNDWVRIGDGSRAEYHQVQAIGATAQHVSLRFALHGAHAAGTALRAFARAPLAALADADFELVDTSAIGATTILIDSGDDAGLLTELPPLAAAGTTLLVGIGAAAAAEYAFATRADDLGGGIVRLTLAHPLRLAHDPLEPVNFLELPAGTATTLALPSNGGDALLYPATVAAAFQSVANVIVIDAGGAAQEAHGIGELATLPLTVGAYLAYPAGTRGRRVTATVDDRTFVGFAGSNAIVTLDRVDGLAPGMTLTFEVGGLDAAHIVDAVDAGPSTVTLRTPLSAAPSANDVTLADKTTSAAVAAGAIALPLRDRLGIAAGDVLRIGANEIATVREVLGERGVPPDAGAIVLTQPLRDAHALNTPVRRLGIDVDATQVAANLVLGADAGALSLLVSDGTGFAAGDVLRLTLPDGSIVFHRLAAAATVAAPREITLVDSLARGHDAGLALVERTPLFTVRALDAGSWGDRLAVSCRDETQGLASATDVLAANPPPGPGMFSSLQLSSLTGVEAGTILELMLPDGSAAGLALLKVRRVDRASRTVQLDAPGLVAAHMNAHNAAQLAGRNVRVRSREFSLAVMLRRRPDPAVPSRDDDISDGESFRHLSMDPRHSRYVQRVIGTTWTPGATIDDDGLPLRRWDRRSEGDAVFVRVQDLAPIAAREAIRLGPETLVDIMPSGLARAARHPFTGGGDTPLLMNDALYVGVDAAEPNDRRGIHTFRNLHNVALVAAPGRTGAVVQQALIDHCEVMRYRFAVLDGPEPDNDTLVDVQDLRQRYDTKYAAVYHPWVTIPDPHPDTVGAPRQYAVPPSGHVLGVIARVDNERGVHKAPANEVLRGITGLTRYFNKGEQDILNPYPVNINVLRDFRSDNRGIRVWGARCITSDGDYKYVNVRRLMIFLEDSIDRGMQWVVFEPNAEELWARVRRSIVNFLTTVWRNGALEGKNVEQAFFVKCDRTTMTRDDLDNGRLVCVIGVAPVKPAEYVIIRIGLWTADAQN